MDDIIDYESLEIEKLTAEEIFSYIIKSEVESMQSHSQGDFYWRIQFHPHFKKVIGSSLKGVNDELIVNTFYHCLRNNDIFKFNKKHFPLFLRAFEKLLPDLAENAPYICGFSRYHAFLLFDVKNISDNTNLMKSSYDDFSKILSFIKKANVFTNFPNIRKKHLVFDPYFDNSVLMDRIRRAVKYYSDYTNGKRFSVGSSMTIASSIVLLLKDSNETSKEPLFDWQQQKLSRELVWLLGSFYKDFQETNENKSLLKDLYKIYPKEWVDEYK